MTASNFSPKLWDVNSGELLRTFADTRGIVTACNAIDQGTKMLTCGSGGQIRVWDLSGRSPSQAAVACGLWVFFDRLLVITGHDNITTLGSDEEQHGSVVKELVVFPDGSRSVALTSSSPNPHRILA